VKVGVLALQGDFEAHARAVRSAGADPFEVRTPSELASADALILPGGESTTIRKLATDYGLLGDFSAGTYVFRDDFIQANPNTVRLFVAGVAKAIEWSRATATPEIVDRMSAIIARRKRNVSNAATKYFKSWGVAGAGGTIKPAEIQTWIDWLVKQGTLAPGFPPTGS